MNVLACKAFNYATKAPTHEDIQLDFEHKLLSAFNS